MTSTQNKTAKIDHWVSLADRMEDYNSQVNRPFELTMKSALRILPADQILTVDKIKLIKKEINLNEQISDKLEKLFGSKGLKKTARRKNKRLFQTLINFVTNFVSTSLPLWIGNLRT